MEKKIAELVNKFHDLVHDHKNEVCLVVELGKSQNSNLLKTFPVDDQLRNYLKTKGKLKIQREYYQYQYQNQIFKRIKSKGLETEIQKNFLLGSSFLRENGVDYRFAIHSAKNLETFSQHVAYHNIIYVREEQWKIGDIPILLKKEKKGDQEVERFYIQFRLPMGTETMGTLLKSLTEIGQIFKSISDSKQQTLTLDSILES